MKIKAAFFDVDGTLVSPRYANVPFSTRQTLNELHRSGIKTFLATGRHALELKQMPVNSMRFDGYVTLNGQICLDEDKNMFYDSPICKQDIDVMIDAFKSKELPIMLVEKDRMYINFINDIVCKAQADIATPLPDIEEYHGSHLIYQFIAYCDNEEAQKLIDPLRNCKMTFWNPNAVDIISKNGGKIRGIQEMLRKYGIRKDEMIAFGDGENDLDMLEFSKIGVAMGNADDKVKEKADYITASVDDDGIQKAIKQILNI